MGLQICRNKKLSAKVVAVAHHLTVGIDNPLHTVPAVVLKEHPEVVNRVLKRQGYRPCVLSHVAKEVVRKYLVPRAVVHTQQSAVGVSSCGHVGAICVVRWGILI